MSIQEKDYSLPGAFPQPFGGKPPVCYFPRLKCPPKNKSWIKKEDLSPFKLYEHYKDYKAQSERNFKDIKIRYNQLEAWEKSLLAGGIISKRRAILRGIHPHKTPLMSVNVVRNYDGTSRFIAYNKNMNRYTKISCPVTPKDTIHRDLIQFHLQNEKKKMYYFKIDFKKGFFNLPIKKKRRVLFRFIGVDGKTIYQFNYLTMGSTCSPGIFQTTIFECITRHILNAYPKLCMYQYLDDLIGCSTEYEIIQRAILDICKLSRKYQFTINWEKSTQIPTCELEFLGVVFNGIENTLYIGKNKPDSDLLQAKMEGKLEQYKHFIYKQPKLEKVPEEFKRKNWRCHYATLKYISRSMPQATYTANIRIFWEKLLLNWGRSIKMKEWIKRDKEFIIAREKLKATRPIRKRDKFKTEFPLVNYLSEYLVLAMPDIYPTLKEPYSHETKAQIVGDLLFRNSNNFQINHFKPPCDLPVWIF